MHSFSRSSGRMIRRLVALGLMLSAGGGCYALQYDFDKDPPPVCKTAADCPGSALCGTAACVAGVCKVLSPLSKDAVPAGQSNLDCQLILCDGLGNTVVKADDKQIPDDGNECTIDTCNLGTPKNAAVAKDKPCGVNGALKCDGAGVCTGCSTADQCGVDSACVKWACTSGACGFSKLAVGTFIANPLPGDCKADLCDDEGKVVEKFYADDPAVDTNDCTLGVCNQQDGSTDQAAVPDGTLCEPMTPCRACFGGVCGPCGADYGCPMPMNVCSPLKKLPVGAACTASTDCLKGNCADGVCCDGPCGGTCMACSNVKTGKPNGECAQVSDGTDPNDSCESPSTDVCVQGVCQCYNGIQDPDESNTDCGGKCAPCPGKWVCDGAQGCTGAPPEFCCAFSCADCNGGKAQCLAVEGKPCDVGSDNLFFSVRESNGICEQCGSIGCRCL